MACITEDPLSSLRQQGSSGSGSSHRRNDQYINTKQSQSMQLLNVPYSTSVLSSLCSRIVILPLNVSSLADRLHEYEMGGMQQQIGASKNENNVEVGMLSQLGLYLACSFETLMGPFRLAPIISYGSVRGNSTQEEADEEEEGDEYGVGDMLDDIEPKVDNMTDVREWVASVTKNGHLPFCNLEVNVPFSYSVNPPASSSQSPGGDAALLKHLKNTMQCVTATSGTVLSPQDTVYDYNYVNPCMTQALGAASVYNQRLRMSEMRQRRCERPFSNVMSVRGASTPGIIW